MHKVGLKDFEVIKIKMPAAGIITFNWFLNHALCQ